MKLSDEAAALIAAQYVLGGQTVRVRRAVERRALRDPKLNAALRQWHELASDLAASTTADVPERVWQRIQGQLPALARVRPGVPEEAPWWRRIWVWQSGAAVAAALALAVGVLPRLQRGPTDDAVLNAPGGQSQSVVPVAPIPAARVSNSAPLVAPAPAVNRPQEHSSSVIPTPALVERAAPTLATVEKVKQPTAAVKKARPLSALVAPSVQERGSVPLASAVDNAKSNAEVAPPPLQIETASSPATEDRNRRYTKRSLTTDD